MDRMAIAAFYKWALRGGLQVLALGFPWPWTSTRASIMSLNRHRFRCVDSLRTLA